MWGWLGGRGERGAAGAALQQGRVRGSTLLGSCADEGGAEWEGGGDGGGQAAAAGRQRARQGGGDGRGWVGADEGEGWGPGVASCELLMHVVQSAGWGSVGRRVALAFTTTRIEARGLFKPAGC